MKTYITSVVLTSLLIALSELILPQGKLKTVVNTIFSIVLLIAMISPLNFYLNEDNLPTFNQESGLVDYTDEGVENFFDKKTSDYFENKYLKILKDNDLIAERVEVEICKMEIIKIKVFLSNLVIPEENQHININVVSDYVAKILGIKNDLVEVYA